MDLSRRDFIVSGSVAAAGAVSPAQAQAPIQLAQAGGGAPSPRGFDPADPALRYELVVANGDVLDPSQKLRGKRDIGIRYGQIAAIAPSIPADRAVQRIDVAGKLVTPGLVDLHTHLCPHLGLGLPADELVGITCTTTAVSAGDAGRRRATSPICSTCCARATCSRTPTAAPATTPCRTASSYRPRARPSSAA